MEKQSLLSKLKFYGNRFYWLRPFFLLLSVAALVAFVYGVVMKQPFIQQHLLPVILVFVWSLLMYNGLAALGDFPPPPDKDMGFFRRIGRHIKRFYYKILVFLCFGGLIVLVYLIMRAFRV